MMNRSLPNLTRSSKKVKSWKSNSRIRRASQPRKRLVFEVTGDVIVEAGIEIAAKHISQVQKAVQIKLEELENELKDQKAREIEDLKMESAQHQGRS